jgi:hypothetical protein
MKIELDSVLGGYSLTKINENFQRIQDEFNNKVLYRDNVDGEANTLEDDIDVNSKRLYNLGAPQYATDAARLGDIPTYPVPIGTGAALNITYTPTSWITSINVQSAIEQLANGVVKVANTISNLKTITKTIGGRVLVDGYYAAGDGGGGEYYYDSTDTTSSDNGGSIIVANDGGRWKLIQRGPLNVKQFGAKCDYNGTTGTDDAAAIQSCINSIPASGCGTIRFPVNSNCLINSTLTNNGRRIIIDGGQGVITLGSNTTCIFNIAGTNCEIKNIELNRKSGVTATAAIIATGLQHVFKNITSRDQKWTTVFYGQDLKESHFSEIRVDLDVSTKLGDIFKFDYCVNNTISDSMLGYCAQAFYGSSTAHPSSGYYNEGLLIENVITVFAGKAINFDRGTFVSVSNCVFDFCEISGIFVTNGVNLSVSNTWIASNTTNGFIGIGTGGTFDGTQIVNTTFVRGASAIAGTLGVSLPGPNASVYGCNFNNGMNGGVITQAGPVFGNTYSGGGTVISAISSICNIDSSFLKLKGTDVLVPSGLSGSASAGSNGATPAQVSGYAIVLIGGVQKKIPYYNL